MTDYERVKYLVDKLENGSEYAFAKKIGRSPQSINTMIKDKRSPSKETYKKILAAYPDVSMQWLMFGTSNPFEHERVELQSDEHIRTNSRNSGIPYYDLDITAGDVPVFLDQNQIEPEHHINIFGFSDCTHAFPVYGHSMHPVICNGDVGLFRYIQDKSIILWGSIYLVITRDYRTIKFVRKGQSEEFVILRSHSQNHDDIDIRRDEILELFLYKGKIERTQM